MNRMVSVCSKFNVLFYFRGCLQWSSAALTVCFSHTGRQQLSHFPFSQCVQEKNDQSAEVKQVRHTAQKHIRRGGGMYSQRGLASALISLCHPAQRTRWSPTLPPGRREKMNEGLRVLIISLWISWSIKRKKSIVFLLNNYRMVLQWFQLCMKVCLVSQHLINKE